MISTPTFDLPSRRLLLALSGGADSVALLLMLLDQGITPVAAHCNFHLRGSESDRDEAFVRQLCKEHGVRLMVKHFDTTGEATATGESIEMAARRLRYAWFEELLLTEHLDYICTAHHRDDQVETVLLNLVRGTGLAGLRGMKPIQGHVYRPLLNLMGREQIHAFLQERQQPWVEDSTNAETLYQRNLIRHELLPLMRRLNPQADNHIAEAAAHLQEAEQLIESTQENWQKEHCICLPDGLRIPFSIHTRVGATLGESTPGAEDSPLMNANASPLMVTRTAAGIEVRLKPKPVPPTPIEGHRYPATKEFLEAAPFKRKAAQGQGGPSVAYIDAARTTPPYYFRSAEEGDRFQPFGMKGTKLVSDYLTDRHRSRIDKLAQLVLCDQEEILWLCGETIAQRGAITPETTEIIEFRMEDLVVS